MAETLRVLLGMPAPVPRNWSCIVVSLRDKSGIVSALPGIVSFAVLRYDVAVF